jgi:hypothetical protein
MTISPTAPDGFEMICDDCGHSRPVETNAGIELAYRLGWQANQHDRGAAEYTITHHCPRCAAGERSTAK